MNIKADTMKKILTFCYCILTAFGLKAQQQAQYSQYLFNYLYINPAYAGYKQESYADCFYRTQWTGFTGAPKSYSLAIDCPVNHERTGVGFLLEKDEAGAQSSLSVYGNYSYRIRMGEDNSSLAFGMGAGLVQSGIDGNKLIAVETDDTYIPNGFENTVVPDARAGIMFSNTTFFAGLSVNNMIAKTLSKRKNYLIPVTAPQIYFSGGAIFALNESMKFKPSFSYRTSKANSSGLDLTGFVIFSDRLWLGATYRTAVSTATSAGTSKNKANAVSGIVELFTGERIRLGYAYDYALSSLSGVSSGSHEISLGLYIGKRRVQGSTGRCYYF